MKFIAFPKIKSFDNFYKDFKQKKEFKGLDKDNNPIFELTPLPTLDVEGTVKLHGTHAAVCFKGDEYWTQKRTTASKEGTITGHFGFHAFMNIPESKQAMTRFLFEVAVESNEMFDANATYSIYGEWCGNGVQKKVAISQLPHKMFFIFGIKVTPEEGAAYWIDPEVWKYISIDNERIWNIYQFKTFKFKCDLNNPIEAREYFNKIIAKVEDKCPVAEHFGIIGLGEGIVWNCFITNYKGERNRISFKTKGEKHKKVSKNKGPKKDVKLGPVKLANINQFVSSIDIINRVDQAIHQLFENVVPGKEKTRDVIQWVQKDVFDEESGLLSELSLDWEDVKSRIGSEARIGFFDLIQKSIYGE